MNVAVRWIMSLVAFVLLLGLTPRFASAASPDDWQEPERNGKRLTEWIDILLDPDSDNHLTAASVMIGFGPSALPAVPALALTLSDRDADARRDAAEALRVIGPKAEEAVPALINALTDKDPSVKTASARALFVISPTHSEKSAQALATIFTQKHVGDRIRAAKALEEIGPKAVVVIPTLEKIRDDPEADREVREAVALAIKRIARAEGSAEQ